MDDEKRMTERLAREAPWVTARAKLVKFQHVIPNHWFSTAASECVQMFLHGHFYGCISVAQAYVESLGKYLSSQHSIRVQNDPAKVWERLTKEKVVSEHAGSNAGTLFLDRNDFHHLNKEIEQDAAALESRALYCLNVIHEIENEVFSYTISEGKIVVQNPRYWPSADGSTETVEVFLRNIWA